jgi:NAD-dependent SIR2 family protein deacetylase
MGSSIKLAKEYLNNADAILITSGAGMSVDSGLPDYRSNQGIIAKLNEKGYTYNDISDSKAFLENAEYSWGWYAEQMQIYLEATPHLGYHLIKKYIEDNKLEYFIFTSNVDCMWKKAGFDKNKILEYHGSLDYLQSLSKHGPVWETDLNEIKNIKYDKVTYKCDVSTIPKSKYDNQYARPNVCLFNDKKYFNTTRFYEIDKIFSEWYITMSKLNKRIVVLEIGAGIIVPTIRERSETFIKDYLINVDVDNKEDYAKLIRINPVYTNVPEGHISISLTGLKALELLLS